jgi:hypothetical protein
MTKQHTIPAAQAGAAQLRATVLIQQLAKAFVLKPYAISQITHAETGPIL